MYAGKPDNTGEYDYTETDGFRVYVEKNIPTSPEGLKIDLRGFGAFKRLFVEGIYL